MNKIAFVFGDILVYWNSVIMALAILTGVLLFWSAFIRRSENVAGAAMLCPIAIVASFFFSRLIHWYFRADSYSGLFEAISDYSGYGYALSGAFIGCLLSVTILGVLRIVKEVPLTLDCMSIAGSAAIAVGRLACFFTEENRGEIVTGVTDLPLVYPVLNPTSGAIEYRFATFLFQSVIAAVIFAVVLILFLKNSRKTFCEDGDITLLFLLMYSASQIVLDSTRYDALRLRSNGFISVVQVLAAIAMVMTLVNFTVRLCKNGSWKAIYIPVWLLITAGIGGAAYMEYYVQRHGGEALFAYSVMSICLITVVLLGILLWRKSVSGAVQLKRNKYKGKFSR